MIQPSIQRALLIRCGLGVGVLLLLLSTGVFLLVKRSLYCEVDESISQTAALLANQVELENGKIDFEWKEGIGSRQFRADPLGATGEIQARLFAAASPF